VEVTGSRLSSPTGSDVKDWFYDWSAWRGLSANK
jgi:hypothetical protein